MLTAVAASWMNVRLYRSTETGLASLRVRAFRHIHDLSMLHQAGRAARLAGLAGHQRRRPDQQLHAVGRPAGDRQRRPADRRHRGDGVSTPGSSRSWSTSASSRWRWCCSGMQPGIQREYAKVRERVGEMLGAVAESVVGASVIKAYGSQDRTAERVDAAIDRQVKAAIRAQILIASTFSTGELVGGVRQRRHRRRRRPAGAARSAHRGPAGRVPVPGDAVRLPGAGRHRGAQRRPERHRRLAPGDRDPRHPDRRRRPGRRPAATCRAGPIDVAFDHVPFAYPGGPEVLQRHRPAHRRRVPGWRSSARPARARRRSPSC